LTALYGKQGCYRRETIILGLFMNFVLFLKGKLMSEIKPISKLYDSHTRTDELDQPVLSSVIYIPVYRILPLLLTLVIF